MKGEIFDMKLGIEGHVALVSGGSLGMGREIAKGKGKPLQSLLLENASVPCQSSIRMERMS